VYGTGQQTRSLCFVDDLVDALVALMDSGLEGPFNLGNPQEITISDLAQRVIQLIDPALGVVHQSLPVDDPQRRCPVIDRAQAQLGWEPRVSLDEGLKTTAADLFRQLVELAQQLA